ncbi:class I SAM-dependent methyltransferase [Allosphingosinicella deserti]|uniref:Methyltransferase n=1 Tax=Allosphingosinicella deserti TaxID=2116704 RepID=A0A2P7QZZ2_9SPHN|nr:class I SAM-dependent methyltransferase [Sphingomonas deserti]PSJ43542.1 methyltransferase [Sphingomonas deserti]
MIRQTVYAAIAAGTLLSGCGPTASAERAAAVSVYADTSIAAAIGAETRTPANVARDQYRHPRETLGFFGVEPDDTVVEIWPGGGWYTEILAPLLKEQGSYWAVASERGLGGVRTLTAKDPATYGKIRLAAFPAQGSDARVPDGSADVVLTFRNVHNWLMANPPVGEEAFRQAFAMLKPGGVLGVVEHRLPESADPAQERASGYVKVSTVRRLAEAAGFQLVDQSEINANPRDTKDHPNGVWSLPPSYRGGDTDRARFAAIGESDRMTLKFVKPR